MAKKQEQVQGWFKDNFQEIKSCETAVPDLFFEQIWRSDVIYLHGGDTALLVNALRTLRADRKTFQGKVVIGSSAGASALVTNAWSSLTQKPRKGLGLIDINIMVHYGAPVVGEVHRSMEDWENEERHFRDLVVGDAPVIHLPEGEFVVVSD